MTEGRPASFERPSPSGATFTPKAGDNFLAKVDELKAACNLDDAVIWDVRSDGEWDGSADRGNKRAGHVPGAIHLEWFNLMDRDTHRFKPAGEIPRALAEAGITPDKKGLHVLTGWHPCGARRVCPEFARLRRSEKLRRLYG